MQKNIVKIQIWKKKKTKANEIRKKKKTIDKRYFTKNIWFLKQINNIPKNKKKKTTNWTPIFESKNIMWKRAENMWLTEKIIEKPNWTNVTKKYDTFNQLT